VAANGRRAPPRRRLRSFKGKPCCCGCDERATRRLPLTNLAETRSWLKTIGWTRKKIKALFKDLRRLELQRERRHIAGHLRVADHHFPAAAPREPSESEADEAAPAASQGGARAQPTLRYETILLVPITNFAVTPITPRDNTPNKRRFSVISQLRG
jgi:hypothetical protein